MSEDPVARLFGAGMLALLLAAPAAPAAQRSAPILGRWVGESRCVGNHPACHFEHVLYQIDSAGAALVMHGSRTAGADTVDMGDLDCRPLAALSEATCSIGHGVWHFTATRDSLHGTLTETHGEITRQVVASRRPVR